MKQFDIGSGKADGTATFITMGNAATNIIIMPQHFGSKFQLPDFQSIPDTGATDAFMMVNLCGCVFHFKAVFFTGFFQAIKITGTAFAKPEIITNQ